MKPGDAAAQQVVVGQDTSVGMGGDTSSCSCPLTLNKSQIKAQTS